MYMYFFDSFFNDILFILFIFCSYCQTLGCIGVIPFTSGLVVIFSEANNSDNEALAVQVAMVVIFLAGVSQFLFWTIATIQK